MPRYLVCPAQLLVRLFAFLLGVVVDVGRPHKLMRFNDMRISNASNVLAHQSDARQRGVVQQEVEILESVISIGVALGSTALYFQN